MRNPFFIFVLIFGMFFLNCGPQKPKEQNESVLTLLGALSSRLGGRPATPTPIQPEIPPIVLPPGIVSVSPANAATHPVDWADLGTKAFNNACVKFGDPFGDGNIQIQRILPTSKLITEIRFAEDVNAGNLEVARKGILIPGTLTFPDARTARFESDNPAEFSSMFPYSATASGFTKVAGGNVIPSLTWRFHSNFSGTAAANSSLVETCNLINGQNRCNVKTTQKISEEIQDLAKQRDLAYFYSDLYYFDSGGNQYGIFGTECLEEVAIGAKEQEKEFWILETNVTLPNIPAVPKTGQYRVDSMIIVDTADFTGGIFQFTFFNR